MIKALALIAGLMLWAPVFAQVPTNAIKLLPQVNTAIDDIWPGVPYRSYFPAQIETESCISLTHRKCWTTTAELKTKREYGFGLSQLTIAYRPDGTERFNAWAEVKTMHPDLKDWAWEDRYNPEMQIKAMVVKNWVNWKTIDRRITDPYTRMIFLAVTYNSGSTRKDAALCAQKPGCDPTKWFGNVELWSYKSRIKQPGYGHSFYEISRDYPRQVMIIRRPKYIPYTGE